MPIIIHVDLADKELKDAVREAVKGEIVALTRESIEELVCRVVSEKTRIFLDDKNTKNIIDREIKIQVEKAMKSQIWADHGQLNPEFAKIVKETVKQILQRNFDNVI